LRALILAAGEGSRLKPLTNDRPKVMVELNGRSILDRQVAVLNSLGITDIALATGFSSHCFAELGLPTFDNANWERTNMVASMFNAADFLDAGQEDIIVAYGDIVYEQRVLAKLLESDSSVAITSDTQWKKYWALRTNDIFGDIESFVIDDAKNVLELGKRVTSFEKVKGQFMGLMKFRSDRIFHLKTFYDALPRDILYDGQRFEKMYMTSFIQALIQSGEMVRAVEVKSGWLETDSLTDIELYYDLASQNRLQDFYADW